MPAALITRTELIEYGTRSVDMGAFTNTFLDQAISRATDRVRQAVLNDYTPESFELLTTTTSPDELREIAFALALAIVTRGDAGRPQSITDANVDAVTRLGYIVAGRTHYDKSPNAVLVKVDTGSGAGVAVNSRAKVRVFDETDINSDYSLRNPKV
jgi:hypothetical protein